MSNTIEKLWPITQEAISPGISVSHSSISQDVNGKSNCSAMFGTLHKTKTFQWERWEHNLLF